MDTIDSLQSHSALSLVSISIVMLIVWPKHEGPKSPLRGPKVTSPPEELEEGDHSAPNVWLFQIQGHRLFHTPMDKTMLSRNMSHFQILRIDS